uniref:Sodium-and chloride-dependent glycine transporter 2 n=1 Tax=Heterorhabditis bacteriophora TaxID=37862 RepID=A0A1I7WQV9_HETBA
MIAFYTDFFYNVVIAWGLHYLYASFSINLPWASCNNSYNSPACYEPKWSDDGSSQCRVPNTEDSWRISAAEEYFYKGFLGLHAPGDPTSHVTRGLDDLGDVNWHIVVCLGIVYLICYFSLWKGIGMSGKVLLRIPISCRIILNFRDALITSAINCGTSFLSGFVIFSVSFI